MLLLQAVATGGVPVVATDTTAVLTASAVSVYLIQKLKNASWFKLITPSTKVMNILASMVAAFVAATGIHFTYNATAGTFVVTGLMLSTIVPAVLAWFKSFVMNELIYQGVVNKPSTAAFTTPAQVK